MRSVILFLISMGLSYLINQLYIMVSSDIKFIVAYLGGGFVMLIIALMNHKELHKKESSH
jgi:hypothetical protein